MSWLSSWSPLRVLILVLLKCATLSAVLPMDESVFPRIIVAASHAALSGDLAVLILGLPPLEQLTTVGSTTTEDADIVIEEEEGSESGANKSDSPMVLRVFRLYGFLSELVGEVAVGPLPASGGNISLAVPCGFLSRGGAYSLQLEEKNSPVPAKLTDVSSIHDVQMRTTLEVQWPTPSLSLEPQHFETFPGQPVLATLEYTGVSCIPSPGIPTATYSMQLIYCGSSVLSCDTRNKSHVQVLYSEEIEGFPGQRVVTLRCELFGQSGHYALRLQPNAGNLNAPTTSTYIKVEWSDQFVFNVLARSVYPCDGGSGGVSVLFEYPACRLQGDSVRVYGRLRAEVASLAPPSTLHYVAELKAPPGKHTLTFGCEIFTERFVEYCFSYVSKAYTGAMSQVRVDCIPTFQLQEGDDGGWGPWSQWTPCSSSCAGGTRHRYRFCDTPLPKYGAKFCQGETVQTESCGGSGRLDLQGNWSPADWECRYGKGLAAEEPEVVTEVGNVCRCGCTVILKENRTRRILAASTQACPGRSFWSVQVEAEHRVSFRLDEAKFPCQGQYVRVRDGDSLSAKLLVDVAFDKSEPASGTVVSSEMNLLVEFASSEEVAVLSSCVGGFTADVTMLANPSSDNGTLISGDFPSSKIMAAAGRWALWLTPAHFAAATLLVLMFLASVFLALQYAFKYRKYEIAEDLDSLTDNSACSGSMQGLARRARALSSATLISEVVSLVRMPRRGSPKHARLQEAPADLEDGYESTETQAEADAEVGSAESGTLKNGDSDSVSRATITPNSVSGTPARRSSSSGIGQPEVKYARPVKLRTAVGPVSPVSEEPSTSDSCSRRYSATSTSISLNNVRVPHPKHASTLLQRAKGFSPASTASNISNIRCGKESKDRRNRERLLQGPGSEFSLANQDMDLELDYYDYNVVNAGAAPGSYLGMDPAFLVWIPPLDPGETDILRAIGEDHHYEEIPERRSDCAAPNRLKLDTEGAALTPAEYKLMREARAENRTPVPGDAGSSSSQGEISAKRIDPGESRLHDEIITEYKARLSEGLLPIHRILEESRVRVSDESLSRHARDDPDLIPNRIVNDETRFAPKATRNRLFDEHERSSRGKTARNVDAKRSKTPGGNLRGKFNDDNNEPTKNRHQGKSRGVSSEEIVKNKAFDVKELSRTPTTFVTERRNNSEASRHRKDGPKSRTTQDPDRDYCESWDDDNRTDFIMSKQKSETSKEDFAQLNSVGGVKIGTAVNIPLREFPVGRLASDSPVRVHRRPKDNAGKESRIEKEIQSPDYGVELDIREESKGFYDLIGEGEDGLKFADDDEDYIDNKVQTA